MPTGHVIDSRPPVLSKLFKERFSRNVIHRKPAFPISPTGGLTISFISVVFPFPLAFPSNSSSLFRLFLSLSFFLSAILALISELDVGGGTQTSDLSLSVPTNSPVHVYFTFNAWFRWPPQPFIPFSCGLRLNATYFRSMPQRSSRAPIIIGF